MATKKELYYRCSEHVGGNTEQEKKVFKLADDAVDGLVGKLEAEGVVGTSEIEAIINDSICVSFSKRYPKGKSTWL